MHNQQKYKEQEHSVKSEMSNACMHTYCFQRLLYAMVECISTHTFAAYS